MDSNFFLNMATAASQLDISVLVDFEKSRSFVLQDKKNSVQSDQFELNDTTIKLVGSVLDFMARTAQPETETDSASAEEFEEALEELKRNIRWRDENVYIARSALMTATLGIDSCYIYHRGEHSDVFQADNAYDPERQRDQMEENSFCFNLPKEIGELAIFIKHDDKLYAEAHAKKEAELDEMMREYEDTLHDLNERVKRISNNNSYISIDRPSLGEHISGRKYRYYRCHHRTTAFNLKNAYDLRHKNRLGNESFGFDLPSEINELIKFVEHDEKLYEEAQAREAQAKK